MKAIRVRNLRSFDNNSEQEYVELKPITVFIGKNSCGKSSLLRTFPLLRQSIEANTSGPILWYGQYVDYGAFSEAKNKTSEDNSIFFDYKFDLNVHNKGYPSKLKNCTHPIELNLEVTEKNKRTTTKSIRLNVSGIDFHINFSLEDTIFLDGVNLNVDFFSYNLRNSFIPTIERSDFDHNMLTKEEIETFDVDINNSEIELNEDINDYLDELNEAYNANDAISRENIKIIISILKPLLEENIYDDTNLEYMLIDHLNFSSKEQIEYKLTSLFKLKRDLTSNEIMQIHYNTTVIYIPEIINHINRYFEVYAKNIKYVAPLRATAERFYRFQDLRVEEIDHTGSNLAMLLRNLRSHEIKRFQKWSMLHFGFFVSVPETNSLHYEIKVTVNNQTQNISDMGFGFSQILPIVTTLWLETEVPRFRREKSPITFVIEQPELHLHPEFQSILARVFSAIAQNTNNRNKREINIIFETHSKTMLDAIGDYIEENNCPELAGIYIFDKKDTLTSISKSEFDECGDLINWPIGFFSGR